MIGIAGLLVSVLLVSGGVIVDGTDVNWGKKVACFVVDQTVLCPGCNYRAGLTCPRNLKNSRNCLQPSSTQPSIASTQQSLVRYPTKPAQATQNEISSTDTTLEEIDSTETTFSSSEVSDLNATLPTPTTTMNPVSMALRLYRMVGKKYPVYRYKRETEKIIQQEIDTDDESDVCNWNGDCACPLICCRTGPGCPKRCVMGIRLPPPWG